MSPRELKAIPTIYRGVQMRSRFEANTAEFLDMLGVEWEYEPVSFLLGGVHYRPDFFCEKHSLFVECRGYETAKGEKQIERFAQMLMPGTVGKSCAPLKSYRDGPSNRLLLLRKEVAEIHPFLPPLVPKVVLCLTCHKRGIAAKGAMGCASCEAATYEPTSTIAIADIKVSRGTVVAALPALHAGLLAQIFCLQCYPVPAVEMIANLSCMDWSYDALKNWRQLVGTGTLPFGFLGLGEKAAP